MPTEKSARSSSAAASASGVASSTTMPPSSVRPAERPDANARTFSCPRAASSRIVTAPTAPVAPITPILASPFMPSPGANASWSAATARGTSSVRTWQAILIGEVEITFDSTPMPAERGERLRGDARMALHAGADEAHLAEVVAHRPFDVEPAEQLLAGGAVLERRAEDDLVGGDLEDRVDVDALLGELGEQERGVDLADAVERLAVGVRDAADDRFLQHRVLLVDDPRPLRARERGADVQPHVVVACELDRA